MLQPIDDVPEIRTVSYAANTYGLSGDQFAWVSDNSAGPTSRRITFQNYRPDTPPLSAENNEEIIKMAIAAGNAKWTKRMVIVLVVDPDKNVPVDKSVLCHKGPFMTDMDDQELFMTSEVHKLLDEHNRMRANLEEDVEGGKKRALKPIRLRDLKMTVVEMAVF